MQRIFGGLFCFLFFALYIEESRANTECLWATGVIQCRKNQSRVIGAIVEVYDLDRPEHGSFFNPLDPDDKVGLSLVDSETGLWQVEGCANDQDWLPGFKNKPEFYIKVNHKCNSAKGEVFRVAGVFRVYTPETYDHHIHQPIVLDDDYKEEADGFEVVELGSGLPEEHPRR